MKALTKTDKRVVRSFLDRKADDSKKLSTDGKRLDGNWMGGNGIAEWKRKKLVFKDLGDRSTQTVQRAVKKMAAPSSHETPKQIDARHRRAGRVYCPERGWIQP